MKLNPTDGYVINPWIIWGELDYRGRVSLGVKPEINFKDLSFLKELNIPVQFIHRNGQDYLFINFSLADFTPKTSIFNLSDKKLKKFYSDTLENSQDEIQKTYFRIKHLSGHEIDTLQTDELAGLWHSHFNPLLDKENFPEFDPGNSILGNCLPGYKARQKAAGFELNGCIHHFIKILDYSNLTEITGALRKFSFSISSFGDQSLILIHNYGNDPGPISEKSLAVKEALHSIPGTDYYEANDIGSSVCYFEYSIPGWCFMGGGML